MKLKNLNSNSYVKYLVSFNFVNFETAKNDRLDPKIENLIWIISKIPMRWLSGATGFLLRCGSKLAHNFPFNGVSEQIDQMIGDTVGVFHKVWKDKNGRCEGSFIWIRTLIDVSEVNQTGCSGSLGFSGADVLG